MRGYWVRIFAGALAVFVVGYGVISLVRSQSSRVRDTLNSSSDINVPLALLPFVLDGQRIGTFRGLRILRSDPRTVREVRIRVRVDATTDLAALADCRLTTQTPGAFNPEDGLRCVGDADSGLISFGTVRLEVRGGSRQVTLPLLLDSMAVRDLAGRHGEEAAALGRLEAEAARAQAEEAKLQARQLGDSIRAAVESTVRRQVQEGGAGQPQKKD